MSNVPLTKPLSSSSPHFIRCVRMCSFVCLPAQMKPHRAEAYKFSPRVALDNEAFNRNRNSRDHLNLYEVISGAAVGQSTGTDSPSIKLGSYLLYTDYFLLFFFPRPVFNEVERREGLRFCYALENRRYFQLIIQSRKNLEKWRFLKNHLNLVKFSFS